MTGIITLLSSCLKDELPVPRVERGGVQEVQLSIGPAYDQQVWYDIGTNTVVAQNNRMDWDLAFECAPNGWMVRLNSARYMRVVPTGSSDLTQPTDTSGFGSQWRYDYCGGDVDSLAIGDWRATEQVVVLDLGLNAFGASLGLRRMKVLSVNSDQFTFEIASMDGTGIQQFVVQKDPTRAYVHFSILSGTQVLIAPPLGTYDIVFTQYTYQFQDPYLAYLVSGAVNGFSGAHVSKIIANDFAAVALADSVANPFNGREDRIGYDWKEFNFDTGVYQMHPDQVYIVQDSEGYFFKLHFTDWYNQAGQRGYPRFEVVPL